MAKKTKKPTGLSITRKGNDFTCKWSHGEKYGSQHFEYKVDKTGGSEKWVDKK